MDSATNSSNLWQSLSAEFLALGYEIIDCVSSTENSLVLKGVQLAIQREVAIKVLTATVAESDPAGERFQREAKLLASFDHPNIVRLFAVGQLKDGRNFMVMEYVHGTTLAKQLEAGNAFSEKLICTYAIQICSALTYAHERNIVHRDLKPANIIVEPAADGDSHSIKLVDFGVHKNNTGAANQKLTSTGSIAPGTSNYMSPEQCRGEQVDARSDIYSLGCMLFELCNGKAPMDGPTDWQILSNHLNKKTSELSFKKETSAGLKAIILRCLEKDRSLRWANADELSQALANGNFVRTPRNISLMVCITLAASTLLFVVAQFLMPHLSPQKRITKDEQIQSASEKRMKLQWRYFEEYRGEFSAEGWQQASSAWLISNAKRGNLNGLNLCFAQLKNTKSVSELVPSLIERCKQHIHRMGGTNDSQLMGAIGVQIQAALKARSWPDTQNALTQLFDLPYVDRNEKMNVVYGAIISFPEPEFVESKAAIWKKFEPSFTNSIQKAQGLITIGVEFKDSNPERSHQYALNAVNAYIQSMKETNTTKIDSGKFNTLCRMLQTFHDTKEILRLEHAFPPEKHAANNIQASNYLIYAKALLESGRQKEAEEILDEVSADADSREMDGIASQILDLQLLAALGTHNSELIKKSAIDDSLVFCNANFSRDNLDFYALRRSWELDPNIAQICTAALSRKRIYRPHDLANLLCGYATYLRESKKISEALHYYQLAQKYYEQFGKYSQGRVVAFVGECRCYTHLNDIAGADKCILAAKEYITKYGPEAGYCTELKNLECFELKARGDNDSALKVREQIVKDLCAQRGKYPRDFAWQLQELADDYKSCNKNSAALRAIEQFQPFLNDSIKEVQPYSQRIRALKRKLEKMPLLS